MVDGQVVVVGLVLCLLSRIELVQDGLRRLAFVDLEVQLRVVLNDVLQVLGQLAKIHLIDQVAGLRIALGQLDIIVLLVGLIGQQLQLHLLLLHQPVLIQVRTRRWNPALRGSLRMLTRRLPVCLLAAVGRVVGRRRLLVAIVGAFWQLEFLLELVIRCGVCFRG